MAKGAKKDSWFDACKPGRNGVNKGFGSSRTGIEFQLYNSLDL